MIAIIIIIILIAIGIYYYITLPIKVMDNSNSKIVSNMIPPPQYPTRMGYCDSTMDRCPNIIESSEDGASIKFDENTGSLSAYINNVQIWNSGGSFNTKESTPPYYWKIDNNDGCSYTYDNNNILMKEGVKLSIPRGNGPYKWTTYLMYNPMSVRVHVWDKYNNIVA